MKLKGTTKVSSIINIVVIGVYHLKVPQCKGMSMAGAKYANKCVEGIGEAAAILIFPNLQNLYVSLDPSRRRYVQEHSIFFEMKYYDCPM